MSQDEYLLVATDDHHSLILSLWHLTLIKELRRGSPVMQQSLAMVLGVINYNSHPKAVTKAFEYILDCLKPKVSDYCHIGRLSE